MTANYKNELKDLYKAVRIYCIIIRRLGFTLKDRDNMLDARDEAFYIVKDFHEEYGLSKCMRKFLIHRINQEVMATKNR